MQSGEVGVKLGREDWEQIIVCGCDVTLLLPSDLSDQRTYKSQTVSCKISGLTRRHLLNIIYTYYQVVDPLWLPLLFSYPLSF